MCSNRMKCPVKGDSLIHRLVEYRQKILHIPEFSVHEILVETMGFPGIAIHRLKYYSTEIPRDIYSTFAINRGSNDLCKLHFTLQ